MTRAMTYAPRALAATVHGQDVFHGQD